MLGRHGEQISVCSAKALGRLAEKLRRVRVNLLLTLKQQFSKKKFFRNCENKGLFEGWQLSLPILHLQDASWCCSTRLRVRIVECYCGILPPRRSLRQSKTILLFEYKIDSGVEVVSALKRCERATNNIPRRRPNQPQRQAIERQGFALKLT